jgi:hypothetical protein
MPLPVALGAVVSMLPWGGGNQSAVGLRGRMCKPNWRRLSWVGGRHKHWLRNEQRLRKDNLMIISHYWTSHVPYVQTREGLGSVLLCAPPGVYMHTIIPGSTEITEVTEGSLAHHHVHTEDNLLYQLRTTLRLDM